MGRKKKYDRDNLVLKAMCIFREHGYAGTSTQMLVEGLGVNRFSLYAEFDNKQKLFEAALERYNQENVERNFGPLEAPDAGAKEIRLLLEFFMSAIENPAAAGKGCLLCNTAVEFGAEDPSGAGFVQMYFNRISKAYTKALNNEEASGKLRPGISIHREADFLTTSTLGLFVMIRAAAPKDMVQNAAKAAIDHLDGLIREA